MIVHTKFRIKNPNPPLNGNSNGRKVSIAFAGRAVSFHVSVHNRVAITVRPIAMAIDVPESTKKTPSQPWHIKK